MITIEFDKPVSYTNGLDGMVVKALSPELSVGGDFTNPCGVDWACQDVVISGGAVRISPVALANAQQPFAGGANTTYEVTADIESIAPNATGIKVSLISGGFVRGFYDFAEVGVSIAQFTTTADVSDTLAITTVLQGTGDSVMRSVSIRRVKQFTSSAVTPSPSSVLEYTGTWSEALDPSDTVIAEYTAADGDYREVGAGFIGDTSVIAIQCP